MVQPKDFYLYLDIKAYKLFKQSALEGMNPVRLKYDAVY